MFWRKPKRQLRGKPLSAAKINQLADNAEWISKLSVAPPLAMQSNPTGTHIYLQRPEPVWARLSGSTSPYSWVEVYSSAPGTWTTLPGGRTGTTNAYELNAKAGCTEVVELTAMGGWYAFQWVGFGCSLVFDLFHPASCPARGATVDFKVGGVTVFSGVTNSVGRITWTGASPGVSYTIDWSFAGLTGTTSTTGCTPVAVTTALPTGYTTNCADAMPTLYITDQAGTREIYPSPECVDYNWGGIDYSFKSTLTATGSCLSPTWLLVMQQWDAFGKCAGGIFAPISVTSHSFSMSCTRPMSRSGTYTGSVPFSGTGYLIHE